ncbi:MAG TPA: type IV pilus twitching motility protein PilT [Planctomycetota bacterium]|jgi:twitching motility protein PilT|nr:type IV pilus twitching motility protein PilT [Planctomycetota bacterium]
MVTIEELVQQLVERSGSDLHLSAGAPPMIRIHGKLVSTEQEVLETDVTKKLIYSILDNEQILRFEKDYELDMSFGISGLGRFRTNVFYQRGAIGAVLRVIPYEIKPMAELGLPVDVCEEVCSRPKGLILVTGATGSGKSTTLASMIDFINRTRNEHIMIIEDPIEFVHQNKCCLINQREVGTDTRGFRESLRTVLRQDPDVIMVGELRDQETISSALTIAETGHLTFATLHTNDVVQTINRLVDVFPSYQQQQIRTQLSFTLQAVFCQQLLVRADNRGRSLAVELMIATPAVRALIREDKAHQLMSIIQTGGKHGMKTMNQSLADLYRSHQVTFEETMGHSVDPEDLKRILQKQGTAGISVQGSTGGH